MRCWSWSTVVGVAAVALPALVITAWVSLVQMVNMVPSVVRVRIRGPLPADDPHVLALLKSSYLHPPSTMPYNLSTDPMYMKHVYLGSWHFIHEHVVKIFGEQQGGFFVEAGALDGERNSNTFWLEKELGWTGLLVEPNPFSFAKLITKQRKVWTSNTCLSPHSYPEETVLVSVARKTRDDPKILQPALTHRGASHLIGYELDADMYRQTMAKSDASYVVTQCFPLASYLVAVNVTTVDFLSLDIQGVEKDVLVNLLPRDDITVRVIVVEVVGRDVFDSQYRNFMKSNNYTLVGEGDMDYVFIKNNDPLLDRINKTTDRHR